MTGNSSTHGSVHVINQHLTFYWFLLASLLVSALVNKAHATESAGRVNAVILENNTAMSLGKHIRYIRESDARLTLTQVQAAFETGDVSYSNNDSISLGIGVNPVWLAFKVNNTSTKPDTYRLTVETPWLDYIDTYIVAADVPVEHIAGGDAMPFEQRPKQYKYYAFDADFQPGITQVFIRVQSKGPMAIPVRIASIEKAIERDISSAYQYGALYGIMVALALYNLVLFVFIRQAEYGLYGLYLLGFVINSLSYTGQLHEIITSDFGPYFQDWVDIFLMITYSVAGLHFARALLKTKTYAPKLDRFVLRTTLIIPAGMLIGFLVDHLVMSIILAFILNCGFVLLFIAMGVSALKANKPFAGMFVVSSVTAALCISISTLAVAGILIPYNDYTFKAIEVGMTFEAILLAVILAQQFRMAQLDKQLAETYARTDMLSQLNNRRGFQQITNPVWQNLCRQQRDAAVVLIDIDDFKGINDKFGHDFGDQAIKLVADCVKNTARKGDISARWGGEEFVILLPETDQQQALIQAERIRQAISQLLLKIGTAKFSLTASIGVAGSSKQQLNTTPLSEIRLEQLINLADKALYKAKSAGKNQVVAYSTST